MKLCEHCGARNDLTLTACSGGATGDVYLCRLAFAEHLTAPCESDPGVMGCSDCAALIEGAKKRRRAVRAPVVCWGVS